MPEYESDRVIEHPIERVFEFFTNPSNMIRILPEEANAELVEAPDQLEAGSEIEIRLELMGFSQRLRMQITELEHPHRIRDEQLKGPFKVFAQTHRFEPVAESQTRLVYQVDLQPGGMIGFMVGKDKILKYLHTSTNERLRRTEELLDSESA